MISWKFQFCNKGYLFEDVVHNIYLLYSRCFCFKSLYLDVRVTLLNECLLILKSIGSSPLFLINNYKV
jgi:hypothetical protein